MDSPFWEQPLEQWLRPVAHLAADPLTMEKSGQTLVVARLALVYGFTDIDRRQPTQLTLQTS